MEKRKIGRSELEVVPLALGGNVFGWTIDEAASFRILDAFVAAGLDFIDTADVYSRWAAGNQGGESETILGRWLRQSGKRDQIVLATKVGMDMGDGKKGLSKAYILRAVEDSLKRLQTDRIDLYQTHKDEDPGTPQQETLEAYDHLIKQGKVRVIGASNFTAARLAEALKIAAEHGLPRYECLQPHYNLVERAGYEAELEPLCRRENIGVIPYYSLASGFLTGKYRSEADLSKSAARSGNVKKYLNDRGFRVVKALDEVAAALNAKPASVALAWLIARPGITAPIASATSVEQLDDLIQAVDLKLDAGAIRKLDEAGA
ncbi:aldo/keto reductase [Paludisphaera soli]|uniref:aldo/keto reductase n=1 Tax=Paludisphaera soli TaxID=2712865 RepID=UPI0013EB49D6|nr:aldo/keto reductase [Paludisphaera soli]